MDFEELIGRAEHCHRLTEEEITALLAAPEAGEKLRQAADRVRQKYVGGAVWLRGLIEFSSYCRNNCSYCGLRRDNERTGRFRLTEAEILRLAERAVEYGYGTVVLQSGEDMYFSAERLAGLIRKIKMLGLAVTLSVGERPFEDYRVWREAGADRFLLRVETTDEAVYARHNPGMSLEARRDCLDGLRRLGYEVGTGSLVGLPGQTEAMLARDILFFQALDADMVGIGPLIPHPDTPLKDAKAGDIGLVLRMVALLRLLLPEANIPATTAMETLLSGARLLALRGGANVIMPNLTEGEAREQYALYPGKAGVADRPEECRLVLREQLASIGRYTGEGKGSRRHERKIIGNYL